MKMRAVWLAAVALGAVGVGCGSKSDTATTSSSSSSSAAPSAGAQGGAGAGGTAETSAAPATAAAGATKLDLSTPHAAALTFATAARDGDVATAKAAVVDDPRQQKLAESFAGVLSNLKKFREAVGAKFGPDGQKALGGGPAQLDLAEKLNGAQEQVTGDTATLTPKPVEGQQRPPDPITLKKEAAGWKVDFGPKVDQMSAAMPQMQKLADAYGGAADDVNAGKCATLADVRQAIQQRVIASLGLGGGGTTMPAPGSPQQAPVVPVPTH